MWVAKVGSASEKIQQKPAGHLGFARARPGTSSQAPSFTTVLVMAVWKDYTVSGKK